MAGNLKTNALEDTKQDEHHEALDKEMSSKKVLISDAIEKRDVDALAELAVSRGGFLSDDLRQRACMEIDPLNHFFPFSFFFFFFFFFLPRR